VWACVKKSYNNTIKRVRKTEAMIKWWRRNEEEPEN